MELDLFGEVLERTGPSLSLFCFFVRLVLLFQIIHKIAVGVELLKILQRLGRVEVKGVFELLQFVLEDLLSLLYTAKNEIKNTKLKMYLRVSRISGH